jgi:hypothetical protein
MTKTYSSANSFRTAIEERISKIAKKDGIDPQRLRRDVAFDRLLVRLFQMPSPIWALKGGYAMQLRTDSARTTKDVDLALKESKLFSTNISQRNEVIRETLLMQAALDLGDYFTFIISEPIRDLNAAPEGGFRYHVEARLADRTFEKFHLDIGAGDAWTEPLDKLQSSNILEFAGFAPQLLLAIPKEQQFAEKLHAYTLPRPDGAVNSRVKDLIDMNLLIESDMNLERLSISLKETFDRRATHPLNLLIMPPPASWSATFTVMAKECGLPRDINSGFTTVYNFLKKLQVDY